MKAIVDIIGNVINEMKPTIDADGAVVNPTHGVTVSGMTLSVLRRLYVSEPVKLTFSGGAVVYGSVHSIDYEGRSFIISLSSIPTVPPTAIEVVLNYHHGHPLEIINTFKNATHVETLKFEQFPAICLFQDIPEKHSIEEESREASLNLAIITATDPGYTAPQRYDATFDPILIPLYELLISKLSCNDEIQLLPESYDYFERLYWGKNGLYGNVGNLFNDFIDAIEINNLRVKTLKMI